MKQLISRIYFRFLSALIFADILREIRYHEVFDETGYLQRYPEVGLAGIDPILHFLLYGRLMNRHPGHDFLLCYQISRKEQHNGGLRVLLPWLLNRSNILRRRDLAEIRKSVRLDKSAGITLVTRPISPSLVTEHYQSPENNPGFEREPIEYRGETSPRLLAFYLPQYHPFEENDRFWGKGFTEWANVAKAMPLFPGHYQPRLPGELGFYDTRLPEVMHRQAELAKQAGIFGFCFHHYYFEGKKVMRVPYDYLINHRALDIPFCLHWANESWSAKFDGWGKSGGMLLEQKHSPEHDILFLKDIEKALKDDRYICIDKKPLLLVYRPQLFPDANETVERWQDFSMKMGLPGLFLVMAQTSFDPVRDPRVYGFDAAVEFPPHKVRHVSLLEQTTFYDPGFNGKLFNYPDVAEYSLSIRKQDFTLFRGIIPSWDNTARIREPYIYHHATPRVYQEWLTGLGQWSLENNLPGQQYVFINAWNEWAEGAYLEPDRKYGYGWLNATARAMNFIHERNHGGKQL